MKVNHVYNLDHRLRVESKDLISQIHDYGIDIRSGHVYLTGEDIYNVGVGAGATDEPGVEHIMATRFIKNLGAAMRTSKKPIVIHMKTSGGSWEEGMAIYDTIKSCPVPVVILNYTHARSMSSIIFQAANKKVMMPHSHFMFHEGTLEIGGTNKQVKSAVKFDASTCKTMLEIYATEMKRHGEMRSRTVQQIKSWLQKQMDKKEDVYLSASRTVELGLADEIFNGDWLSLTKFTKEQLSR